MAAKQLKSADVDLLRKMVLTMAEALAAVYEVTGGNPRLINSLCDDYLLLTFFREVK